MPRQWPSPPPPEAGVVLPVYLLGTAFSGSTLLGNALNAIPGVVYAGEVSRLPRFGIGAPETTCILCLARHQTCPVWNEASLQSIQDATPGGYVDELGRLTGAQVVVDGSKDVRWFWASAVPSGRARVIHIVRSPFGFVDTARRVNGYHDFQAAAIWRDTAVDVTRSVNQARVPALVVRYEDLALDPEPVLRDVCRFVDVDFDEGALHFWDTPVHAIGGNPGAYAWYPEVVEWYGAIMAALRAGDTTLKMAPDATRDYCRRNPPRPEQVEAITFQETLVRYSQRKFGGWADDKWRAGLPRGEMANVMRTPSVFDTASLVGYHLTDYLEVQGTTGGAGAAGTEGDPGVSPPERRPTPPGRRSRVWGRLAGRSG
jgi:hypothetical protein